MKKFGLILGPLLFVISLLFPTKTPHLFTVIGIGSWMISWWITESVPLPVSAILPLVLFPSLGILDWATVSEAYGHRLVFLFFGGFIIALALEKWDLHRRIALKIIEKTGFGVKKIILGFMLATAFLSMWISNTATTVMMLPIANSFLDFIENNNPEIKRKYAVVLFLSIAFAANIGGTATLIGTPPNVQMAGILQDSFNISIDFISWLMVGLPFAAVLLFLTYLLMTSVLFSVNITIGEKEKSQLTSTYKSLGKITAQQRLVLIIFMGTVFLWSAKNLINSLVPFKMNDTTIALIPSILFFVVSVANKPLLEWRDTRNLPWGILLLFGGGLTLASAMDKVDLLKITTDFIVGMGTSNEIMLLLFLTLIALFLTELMSNLALVSIFVPVVCTLALELGVLPVYFCIPVTLASSCAFMLPMATPPNAIVFASNKIKVLEMVRSGVVLNLVAVLLIMMMVVPLVQIIFG